MPMYQHNVRSKPMKNIARVTFDLDKKSHIYSDDVPNLVSNDLTDILRMHENGELTLYVETRQLVKDLLLELRAVRDR